MNELNFTIDPQLPLWLIALVMAILAAMVVFGIIRRMRGAWIRAIAAALIGLALLNPSILREEREPLKSVVALVVDESASQKIDGRLEQTRKAAATIKAEIEKLGPFEIRETVADDFVSEATDVSTALFSSTKFALQDVPADRVAGVIMVTDGQVHDIPDKTSSLGFDAPVHALITGHDNEMDRNITIINVPKFGIVNEEQEVVYKVDETGFDPPSQTLNVSILLDGKELAVDQARPGRETTFRFPLPHGGKNILELRVEEDANEITEINNRTFASINGIRENLRVLLVSGEPNAGERTWRNLLKADASVDLVHFTILRPPEKQDGTPISQLSLIAFPTRELFVEKIDQFDLIIFDRYRRRGVLPLLYFENIADYVRNGGAVLVAAGPEYANADSISLTPLINILPASASGLINEKPFRPRLTGTGKKHPVTRDLPGSASEIPGWSRWFRSIQATDTSGKIVMQDEDKNPLLMLKRVEKGRVALLLSDHAWLWARNFEGGGPYLPLLRRTAHWLMQEPELDEERLSASARGQDIKLVRQTLKDTTIPIELTGPDGKTVEVTPEKTKDGIWSKTVKVDQIGLYQAKADDLSTLVQVGPANPREYSEVISTTKKLKPITDETGGTVLRIAKAGIPDVVPVNAGSAAYGRGWLGLKDNHASRLVGIKRIPLFSGLLGLALLLFAFVGMWMREGR